MFFFFKSVCYSHNKEDYLRSLQEGIPPVGLMKKPPIVAILEDFQMKWDDVLHMLEMNLVQLLNVESHSN